MATYSRQLLSGSTNGLPVVVAATSSPGTTIHTALTGTTGFDEVYLWASNVTASAATLTLQWGGTTDPTDDLVYEYSIPANSPPIPIATGQVLNNALVVKAWSQTASAINLTGFVNRIQ
jgi:hypothetical protein